MAYSALVRRLLISCPGDVPTSDLAIVHKAIDRWNGIYGKAFGAVILPISWGTHAAAEFGRPPQDILNKQLVDQCDICLALFANRLGTPTASAESGTAEEIARLSESGRYVGVLRSRRGVSNSEIKADQLGLLEHYLETIKTKALILDYADDADLIQKVDNILVGAVSHDQGRTELQLQIEQAAVGSPERQAEVWPRIDISEKLMIDGYTSREWYLVLSNTGDAPARDVEIKMEVSTSYPQFGRQPPTIVWELGSEPRIPTLAPHSEVRFRLAVDSLDLQLNCIVSWMDNRGRQENTATLRIV
jgi:hypothetical protein